MSNYEWTYLVPSGWTATVRELIDKCEAIDPTYEIYDLKEKWGRMSVFSDCQTKFFDEIEKIEREYEDKTAKICCRCGKPAVKVSTGWILPWCDTCGTDTEQYYKRFNK